MAIAPEMGDGVKSSFIISHASNEMPNPTLGTRTVLRTLVVTLICSPKVNPSMLRDGSTMAVTGLDHSFVVLFLALTFTRMPEIFCGFSGARPSTIA